MAQSPKRWAEESRSVGNRDFQEVAREGAVTRSRQQFLVRAGSEEAEEECS